MGVEHVWSCDSVPGVGARSVWRLTEPVQTNMTSPDVTTDDASWLATGTRVGTADPRSGYRQLFCADVGGDGQWRVRWITSHADLMRVTGPRQGQRRCDRYRAAADYPVTSFEVVAQPADGNCFFHSVGHHLDLSAAALRERVTRWMMANRSLEIEGHPLSSWIEWEGLPLETYVAHMANGKWGGATELAILTHMYPSFRFHVLRLDRKDGQRYDQVLQVGTGGADAFLLWSGTHYDALRRRA